MAVKPADPSSRAHLDDDVTTLAQADNHLEHSFDRASVAHAPGDESPPSDGRPPAETAPQGAAAVMRIIASEPDAARLFSGSATEIEAQLCEAVAQGQLGALVRRLSAAQHAELVRPALHRLAAPVAERLLPALEQIFYGSNAGALATMQLCFALRFHPRMGAGMERGRMTSWSAVGLVRAWAALADLPASHELQADFFDHIEPTATGS